MKTLHINIFCGRVRKFLVEPDHPLRFDTENFGVVEERFAPIPVSGAMALAHGQERVRWLQEEGRLAQADPIRRNEIKHVLALFKLPYWKVSTKPTNHSFLFILIDSASIKV